MDDYIFNAREREAELNRLRMIETAVDHISIENLKTAGIKTGDRCLEVGPGAGSILSWLGQQVGPEGLVLGVDKDIRHLHAFDHAPYKIVHGDICDFHVATRLNLVHCRYVLIHNQHSEQVLKQAKKLLKPGAYLIVEEPDFTSAKYLNPEQPKGWQNVNAAICAMFENMQLNPAYGLSLPAIISRLGFEIVGAHTITHLNAGQSSMARMMATSTLALQDKYIDTGLADAADIDTYVSLAMNPESWAVYYSTVSVIARLPGDHD